MGKVIDLKELLESYGRWLENFDTSDYFEASALYLERLSLEHNKDKLSEKDLGTLKEYDKKALKLYNKLKNLDTDAVDYLKDTVSIIKGKN